MTTSATPTAGRIRRALINIAEFRETALGRLSRYMDMGEHIVIQRRGRLVGVVVPVEWYREVCSQIEQPFDL